MNFRISPVDLLRDDQFSISNEIARRVAKNTQDLILTQLEDLVKRGLLVVESEQPVLTSFDTPDGTREFKLVQSINLVLKDKEHIEKLETENRDLKNRLEVIQLAIGASKK